MLLAPAESAVRSSNSRGLIDRAVGACFAVLAGATALFLAVKLITAIIVPLLIITGVVVVVIVGVRVWHLRSHRW